MKRQRRPASAILHTTYLSGCSAAGWWNETPPLWPLPWRSMFYHSQGARTAAHLLPWWGGIQSMPVCFYILTFIFPTSCSFSSFFHYKALTSWCDVRGNSWPFGGCSSLEPRNRCLFCTGKMTVSFNSVMTSSRPAMSLHVIYIHTHSQWCWLFSCKALPVWGSGASPACWAGQPGELQYSSHILRASHSSLRSDASTSQPGGRQSDWRTTCNRFNWLSDSCRNALVRRSSNITHVFQEHWVSHWQLCCCHRSSHLFLSLHLLLPGRVDGVHHPLDGEVGDGTEYGETEEQADDLVPAQRTGDVLGRDLPQHHHKTTERTGCRQERHHQTPPLTGSGSLIPVWQCEV